MNNSDPIFLTAREAAGELSVSLATLYAYVSRGMIRSEPGASRARRYRAEDVRALKNRRMPAPGREAAPEQPALDTAVSTITDSGPVYRGVDAVILSRSASLEQTATLLWDVADNDPFTLDNLPAVDAAMLAIILGAEAHMALSRAAAVLSLAADADSLAFNVSAAGRARIGGRIMRLVAAAILRQQPSGLPIHQQLAQAWAPGHRQAQDLLRRALVLLADHELNASTYTVRCAASTGVNLYDATVAGLAALKGPRHGGAGPLAARLLRQIAAGDAETIIRERIAFGEAMPGFGHAVYAGSDPRADELLAALQKAGADPTLVQNAPRQITEATGLAVNIDYALAALVHFLGLPVGHETGLFAIARTAGWIAHAIEQLQTGELIRPRGRYVGHAAGHGRFQPG